jgi:hypothetical protein
MTLVRGMGNAYDNLIGNPEVKRALWGPSRGWEDNIKITLNKRG